MSRSRKIEWVYDDNGATYSPAAWPGIPGLDPRSPQPPYSTDYRDQLQVWGVEGSEGPTDRQLEMVDQLLALPASFSEVMDRCIYRLVEWAREVEPADPVSEIQPSNISEHYHLDGIMIPMDDNYPYVTVRGTGTSGFLGTFHFLFRSGKLQSYGWGECAPAGEFLELEEYMIELGNVFRFEEDG